ncbi:MAG: glycosyltransferase family 2 protein [Deltaproteobacteria bacterium]|nr:glycosyltransferase family 2 protein [Deltaproteobacteria bacterium]
MSVRPWIPVVAGVTELAYGYALSFLVSPIVSVIIPTFNRWPMVGAAIESVLAQSFSDYELIVVDDGSTDDTATQLARFGSRLLLLTQANRGVSAARNLAVRQARGRYLAFLDSDDLWLANKLAIQTAFMERNPSVQICQNEEIWIRNGVRVNPKAKHRKPSGDIFLSSLELCLVSPSAVLLTRELFEQVGGFDETFPVCEDYDLWLRIARDYPVAMIDEPLVVKRGGHADQLSHSIWGMDRYRVLALQKLLRSGLDDGRRIATLDVLRRKVAVLADGARKRGKLAEAQDYENILTESLLNHDGGIGNTRLRGGQELSPADA